MERGTVHISCELVPEELALLNPVGHGRDEPNLDPHLPPPIGRISFTLNPFVMACQLLGPAFRRKLLMGLAGTLFLIALVWFLVTMAPTVGGNVVTQVLNPLNWF